MQISPNVLTVQRHSNFWKQTKYSKTYLISMRSPLLQLTVAFILCFFQSLAQEHVDSITLQYSTDKNTFQLYESKHRGKIRTSNIELNYLNWGVPGNKAFIWLPGSFLSAYDFEPFASRLVQAGYFVISVDHYGHGQTQIPTKDLDFTDFAHDLNDLMDSLSIESAVIGGFSRGAYLATAFYDKYPSKVQKLVLEEGGTIPFKSLFDGLSSEQLNEFLSNVEPPTAIKDLLFSTYSTELEAFKNLVEFNDGTSSFDYFSIIKGQGNKWVIYKDLDTYMHMQNGNQYHELLYSTNKVSKYASAITRVNPISVFARLNIPLLILEANRGPFNKSKEIGNRALKEQRPEWITYKQFDCDDHNIHFACPEEFLKELLHFLNQN